MGVIRPQILVGTNHQIACARLGKAFQ